MSSGASAGPVENARVDTGTAVTGAAVRGPAFVMTIPACVSGLPDARLGPVRLDLVAMDLPAPALAVAALPVDALLEPLEIAVDASLQEAQRIPGRLDRAVRLGIDAQCDL